MGGCRRGSHWPRCSPSVRRSVPSSWPAQPRRGASWRSWSSARRPVTDCSASPLVTRATPWLPPPQAHRLRARSRCATVPGWDRCRTTTRPWSAHPSAGPALTLPDPVALLDHLPMFLAHTLAAVLVGLWLAAGERALWSLLTLVFAAVVALFVMPRAVPVVARRRAPLRRRPATLPSLARVGAPSCAAVHRLSSPPDPHFLPARRAVADVATARLAHPVTSRRDMTTQLDPAPSRASTPRPATSSGWFRAFWRWHFYAAFLVAPVLLILAVTGLIYLFRFQLEPLIHADLMMVSAPLGGLHPAALRQPARRRRAMFPDCHRGLDDRAEVRGSEHGLLARHAGRVDPRRLRQSVRRRGARLARPGHHALRLCRAPPR